MGLRYRLNCLVCRELKNSDQFDDCRHDFIFNY